MFVAGYLIVHKLPAGVSFGDALKVSGASGKLNVITSGVKSNGFDWKDKYNIISGIIGGLFLALSYFGTDQSQVGRYLTAKNDRESKLGLLMNGLVKVPMQFLILLLGALLFTFYQFNKQPIFFNDAVKEKVYQTAYGDSLRAVNTEYEKASADKQMLVRSYVAALHDKKEEDAAGIKADIQQADQHIESLRGTYKKYLNKADASIDTNDTNYIFLKFVVDYLPAGLVGLLIAIIFLAAWGSIAAALNSLASCTMVDFYCRFKHHHSHPDQQDIDDEKKYKLSKWFTLAWGIFCIIVAQFSNRMGSLIEAVNILGSLFYGVILGIFLVAFYMKKIGGSAVFWAAVISELIVVVMFMLDRYNIIGIGFLWFNVIGALLVIILSWIFNKFGSGRLANVMASH
jgi:Na+/proline symporter